MKEKITIRPDFLIIPGPVAFSKKLQPVDKTLYGVIYWLHSLKDGKCTASNAYLAKICGCGLQSVQNSLTRLEMADFIERKFKDAKKKIRSKIIPLVNYRVSSNEDTVYSNEDTRVSSNMGTDKEETISKSRHVAGATDGQDSQEEKDRPMNLQQFVLWCSKSQHAHIRIIGEWAETTKPAMETRAQWEAYIKRHLRPARALVPFSHEQLAGGFARMKEAKYLDTATLETLYKFLTNAKIK